MIRRYSRAAMQSVAGLLMLAGLAFAPPERGRMLLIPLFGAASAPPLAVEGGARLVGRGPFAGSLIVIGERAHFGIPALERGIVAIAAPAFLCGPAGGRGEEA